MIYSDNVRKNVSFTVANNNSVIDLITILLSNGYWVKVKETKENVIIQIKESEDK